MAIIASLHVKRRRGMPQMRCSDDTKRTNSFQRVKQVTDRQGEKIWWNPLFNIGHRVGLECDHYKT